jgi:hypothetical protein
VLGVETISPLEVELPVTFMRDDTSKISICEYQRAKGSEAYVISIQGLTGRALGVPG